jgi:hypothetical protein
MGFSWCAYWCRPEYRGMSTVPQMTEQTNNSLKLWLATKRLDLNIFKALVPVF